jgi:hypothetical protein
MLMQHSFYLLQFDAEAAQLHLVVDTAKEFDCSIWSVAREVAGLIQARSYGVAEG